MPDHQSEKRIPFTKPWFPKEMRRDLLADLDSVMASGELMLGRFAQTLEQKFAALTHSKHAVSLTTATTGLQIALRHAGVSGGEVLVPAASFITDVSAVQMEGATPVLVDIDPATLSFDMADLERKITSRTRAIIWVHLVGYIAENYRQILDVTERHGLFVIEDASHAHGASIDDRPAGSLGDVGLFSFYPTKIMTTGTGGMLVTGSEALAQFAQALRLFGKDVNSGEIVHQGNDWFMDEFRACIGVHQARHLADNLARRRMSAAKYLDRLRNRRHIRCLQPMAGNFPAWYQFPIFLEDGIDSESIRREMNSRNIACKQIYKPVHHEALFAEMNRPGLEGAERALGQSLCLPMFVDITDDEIDQVVETLLKTVAEAT